MECLKDHIIRRDIENDLSFQETLNAADNFIKERRVWFKKIAVTKERHGSRRVSHPRPPAKRTQAGSLQKNSRDGGERQAPLFTGGGVITVYPGYFNDEALGSLYQSVIKQGLKVFEQVVVLVMALPEETREDFAQKMGRMSALTQGISGVTVEGVFDSEGLPEFFSRRRIHHLIRKIYSDAPDSFKIVAEEAIARENYEKYGLDTVFILPEVQCLKIAEPLLTPFVLAFRDMLEKQGVSVPAGGALDSSTVKRFIPLLRNLNPFPREERIDGVDIDVRKGRGPPVTAPNTDSIHLPHNYPHQYIPNRHTAFYAGTFDPFTNGHLEVVRRAAAMFDFVYIGIGPNPDKAGKQWFSRQENKTMIEFCLKAAGITNVKVICYDGLTVDCARNLGARVLLRGVRDYKDLKSELPLAWANLLLDPSIPTVFLVPYVYINVSSSYVKELLREDASVEELRRAISHNIIQPLLSRYEKRGGIYQPRDESLGFDGGARADMLENYFWPGRLRIPVSIQPQWWKAQIKRKGANNGYSGAVRSDGGVNAIKGSLFMLAGLMFQGVWGGTLFGAAVLFFISEDDIAEKAEEERPRLYLILVGAIIPLGLLSYVSGLDFPAGTFWGLAITCFDIAGRLHSQSQPQTAVAINLDGGNIKKTSSPVERMDGGGELPPLLASDQVIPSLRWGLGMWMLPKEMQELLRRPCEIKVNKITGSSAETLSTPAVELLRQKNRLANLGLLDLQTIYRAELDQNTSLILIPDQRDINLEGFLEIFMDRNTQKIIGYGLSHLCGGDLSLGMHFFKEYRLQHRAREIFPSRLAVVNSIFESNEYKLDRLIIPSRQINSPDALGSGALIFYLRFGFRPEGERLNNIAVRIIEGIVYNGEIIQVDILRLFSKKALSLPLENTKDGGHTEPARGRKRTGKDGGDDDKNILSRLRQISSRARNRTVKEFILRASPEVLILSGKVSEQALNVLVDLYGADLARFVKQDRYSNLYMAVNMWDAVFCENPGRRTAPLRWSSEYGKPLRSLARQAFDNGIPYFGENTASQRANFNARARAFLEQARKGGVIVYWHSDRKDFVYTVYDPDEKVSARVCLKLVIGIIAADIESYSADSNAVIF